MSEDGLSPKAAHDVVAKHVAESGMCIFKDKYDNPRPPEIQAKIYFNKEYDLDLFRAEHMPPAPAPVCTRPLPPSPPPPKAPPGQNIVQKRRQVLQLDPTPPLQMRACPTKKRRVSNVSASSGGGGAGDKGDPVTVKCVVNRKDWDKLPTFAQIAKVPMRKCLGRLRALVAVCPLLYASRADASCACLLYASRADASCACHAADKTD
jgi:hypothetical protein